MESMWPYVVETLRHITVDAEHRTSVVAKRKSKGGQASKDTFAWWHSLRHSYLKRLCTHALAKMTPLVCVNFLDVVGQDGEHIRERGEDVACTPNWDTWAGFFPVWPTPELISSINYWSTGRPLCYVQSAVSTCIRISPWWQSVTSRLETSQYRDFSQFFESIGLGLEKKSRYRSRKYLVLKKSLGIGLENI